MSVHFLSATNHWSTPAATYEALNSEFRFNFDPCPLHADFDGLTIDWGSHTFCNPPYSDLGLWLKKGYEEYKKGNVVVMLIPSRTDTKAWHEYAMKAAEIRFLRGRLRFGGAKHNAPFPSAIVVFR